MNIELTEDECTTVLVALDYYRDSQARLAAELYDPQLTENAGSAEWCWQKIFGALQTERSAIADAVGEGEQPPLPFNTQTNSGTSASVDPFDTSTYTNMGDK